MYSQYLLRLFLWLFIPQKSKGNGHQRRPAQNTGHHVMTCHGQRVSRYPHTDRKYKGISLPQILQANICHHSLPLYFTGMLAFLFSHFKNAFSATGNHYLKFCQLIRRRNRAMPCRFLMYGYLIQRHLFTHGQAWLGRIIARQAGTFFAHAQNGRWRDSNTYPLAQSYCTCALPLFAVASMPTAPQSEKNPMHCISQQATVQSGKIDDSSAQFNTLSAA